MSDGNTARRSTAKSEDQMKTATLSHSWTTAAGEATVTVTATCGWITSNTWSDGDEITTRTWADSMDVSATVAGKQVGTGLPAAVSHPVAVAAIGRLALVQANLDSVNAMIASVRADVRDTDECRDHAAELATRQSDVAACDKSGRAILNALTRGY